MGSTARDRLVAVWPFVGLVLRTPRLELRFVDQDLAVDLALLAAEGIHDPDETPFEHPWTDVASPDQERGSLQHYWQRWGGLTADDWTLPFAVLVDGEVVGMQDVLAERFAERRTVRTGSWLGRAHQGRGIGTEMRAAVLHLAFDGLGAVRADTAAWEDNPASLGVTRKLGYRPNGDRIGSPRGVPRRQLLFAMDREDWATGPAARVEVEVEGLAPCLDLLGAGPPTGPDAGGPVGLPVDAPTRQRPDPPVGQADEPHG